ncbi:MAG: TetR/AcrR family transcriptional regulator [Bauldia sp.]|nr:TetR/AcrR family transcriptional regulator [Bauldia sp.]
MIAASASAKPRDRRAKPGGGARKLVLDAATDEIRTRGYEASSVEDICRVAGVSKGAFFHHFADKEALAVAAADHWRDRAATIFADAGYNALADPAARILGYVDLRIALLVGRPSDVSCFLGTMVQEVFDSHPAIRAAVARAILASADAMEPDIAAALRAARVRRTTAASVSMHIQAAIQGALIMAKAMDDLEAAADSLRHLRSYLETLFGKSAKVGRKGGPRWKKSRAPVPAARTRPRSRPTARPSRSIDAARARR